LGSKTVTYDICIYSIYTFIYRGILIVWKTDTVVYGFTYFCWYTFSWIGGKCDICWLFISSFCYLSMKCTIIQRPLQGCIQCFSYNGQLCMVFIQTEWWFLRRHFNIFLFAAVHFFFYQWWPSLISHQHNKINKTS
jgi:hypothetical protein